jgi:glycosyltransferase involved in cell wall biosynthesis
LTIVGRAPTRNVKKLADLDGVAVTGRVEDVRPYVGDAAVYIVPLRIGGGTRLKIFEAMAMGKAVVSTSVGAEGLPVIDGQHLSIADEPVAFADRVIELFRDLGRRRFLEESARSLVMERYDWSAVAGELESALVRVACARPKASDVTQQATTSGASDTPNSGKRFSWHSSSFGLGGKLSR